MYLSKNFCPKVAKKSENPEGKCIKACGFRTYLLLSASGLLLYSIGLGIAACRNS
jgi:hypothetical protein